MSSSRDQITFAGLLTALDTKAACTTKSTSNRRPNPPPSKVRLIVTFSGGSFSNPLSTSFASSGPCSGPHTAQESLVTCAVQFIGSIVAWARNCDSYSSETISGNLPLISSERRPSPSVFTVFQLFPSNAARYCLFKVSVLTPELVPPSKTTLSDLSACRACQY